MALFLKKALALLGLMAFIKILESASQNNISDLKISLHCPTPKVYDTRRNKFAIIKYMNQTCSLF